MLDGDEEDYTVVDDPFMLLMLRDARVSLRRLASNRCLRRARGCLSVPDGLDSRQAAIYSTVSFFLSRAHLRLSFRCMS